MILRQNITSGDQNVKKLKIHILLLAKNRIFQTKYSQELDF